MGLHVPSRAGNDDWLVPQVNAVAYDNPIPGFGTNNVTNLRLFESQPVNEFNLDFFNEGNFDEVSVHKAPPCQPSTCMTALNFSKQLHEQHETARFVAASLHPQHSEALADEDGIATLGSLQNEGSCCNQWDLSSKRSS